MYTGTLPPVMRGTTWSESVQCFDDQDNSAIDISAASEILFQISEGGCVRLAARLSDGSIYLGGTTGVFSFDLTIPSNFCPKTYDVTCLVTLEGKPIPVIVAYLPIIDGHIQ
jgi:hypothetical protein